MRRPRFYTEQQLIGGATLRLEANASRHISRTLRLRAGDDICVFDGEGREAAAKITGVERDAVEVTVEALEEIDRESPLRVTLAIGVSRGDRMDNVVQKATELGAASIQPLLSERTGVRLDAKRWSKKVEHWRRIAISACEQCGRNVLPVVSEPLALDRFLSASEDRQDELRLLLHPGERAADLPEQLREDGSRVTLLVGPEGGFSDSEVAASIAAGYQSLQLGPRVLRTEQAPLAALALVQGRWGDIAL